MNSYIPFNLYAPFNDKATDYMERCNHSWFNVAEGGKRGGKNVINALCFCILLENHPDKLHLIGGYDSASARLNILDCDGYGIQNFFTGRCREGKYKNRECLYINTKTGEKILLVAGGGKANSYKSIKGNTYGMAYITEANECDPSFLKDVFDRTLSSRDRKVFHDLNPQPPAHWYYADILNYHEIKQRQDENYGYNYEHFNIFDNMSIDDDQLQRVLETYDKASIWYKRDILGNRMANSGILFDMIANYEERYITEESMVGMITCGVDFGKTGSKHAFSSQILSRNFKDIQVIRTDEEDCTNQDEVVDNDGIGVKLSQLKKGFIKHVKWVLANYGKMDYIFADSAEPELIDFLQQCLINEGLHIPVKGSIKIPIEDRIHLIGVLLMQERLKFKKGKTKELVKGLQEATQDDTADTDRWLDDGTSDIDIVDAFNYGIEYWHKELMLL